MLVPEVVLSEANLVVADTLGSAEHAGQHINFVVVAKTALPRVLTFAGERGWHRLRLLSSAANTYNRDYHG